MPHHYLVGNDYRDSVFNTIISVRHQSKKRIAVYKHNDRAKDHKKNRVSLLTRFTQFQYQYKSLTKALKLNQHRSFSIEYRHC